MADEGVKIDAATVLSRAAALWQLLEADREAFGGAASLAIVHGKRHEGGSATEPFSVSMQRHLLGYEFPDTIMLLADGELLVAATAKKLEFLAATVAAAPAARGVRVRTVVRERGDVGAPAALLEAARRTGGAVGGAAADVESGPIADAWAAALAAEGLARADATRGIELWLAQHDEAAAAALRKAGALAARILTKVFVPAMEAAVDEDDRGATNAGLAARVAKTAEDPAALEKAHVRLDGDDYDLPLQPLVQSGGAYTTHVMGAAAASSPARFSGDVVIYSHAVRFGTQTALLARTFLFNPTPSQARAYDAAVGVHAWLVDRLRPGAVISQVVEGARAELLARDGVPMAAKTTRSWGCGIGVRVGDKALALTQKNPLVVAAGHAFTVWIGLSDIPLEDAAAAAGTATGALGSYALLIADTVLVAADAETPPLILTEKAPRERAQVAYVTADAAGDEKDGGDGDKKKDKKDKKKDKKDKGGAPALAGRTAGGRSARLAERAADNDEAAQTAARREEHQRLLLQKQREEALARRAKGEAAGGGAGGSRDDEIAQAPDIVAYAGSSEYPRQGRPTQMAIDKAHDCVLLPVFGTLVPFHVATIKSVAKAEEGAKWLLRFNFFSPGQAAGKDVAPSMAAALQRYPESIYVRTLSVMSRDPRNIAAVDAGVKAMQKKWRAERDAARQAADLVEQAKLRMAHDKVPRLSDLSMWPAISGRKTVGTLECHANGLRFVSQKGERVDVIFANIAHAIFQPCEKEHVVLIHLRLRHPILIAKKKYKDVQWYTEVISASQALDGRHRSDHDADEYGEEEREQRLRVDLNRAFKKFVERCESIAADDPAAPQSTRTFDVPQRELGFSGSAWKEMTTLLPCADCLISVVDKPPFVASLRDIEHVHFERVLFSGKNFDLVIIFKPGSREKGEEEWARISSIPMAALDGIKNWLDDIAEIAFTESTTSYNWKTILEDVIRQDDFYLSEDAETGERKPPGWTFLTDEGWKMAARAKGAPAEDEEEASEEESEYDVASSEESSEEASSEEDGSDFLVSEEDDDDEDASGGGGDDDEEEADWDALEKKAADDDKKRSRREMEEDDAAPAKKSSKKDKADKSEKKSKKEKEPSSKKQRRD